MKADNFRNNEGWPQEVGVELRENAGALSNPSALRSVGDKEQESKEGLLEKILKLENLNLAYKRVRANGGSYGVDKMTVEELLPYLKRHGKAIRQTILEGTYKPQAVRRVEIPKSEGGRRELGIPSVVDRVIQQAIAQVLNNIFDKEFLVNSYGFRPERSAHQAIEAARKHIEEGYRWVVDIDLEKFFDRVNHDKLLSLAARKVKDKRVLKLIRKYLESGIMINGVKIKNEEGTPQGGPLSPLLANIRLDELDKELERREHRHCRYADDCNIYVKSRKAGERVLKSITEYIEKRLKLKVNGNKSSVDRPSRRKFLGFSFYSVKGKARNFIHAKCIKRFKEEIRAITLRSNGRSMEWRKERLNWLMIGWVNYFRIADMKNIASDLDGWIRRRIRMCHWKQWKKIKTKHDNLVRLGLNQWKAWEFANSRKGYWKASGSPVLSSTITNAYLDKMGFRSLTKQLSIANKF